MKSRFKRVCVFCGSSSGNRECYRDAATDLAQELVRLCLNLNESLENLKWLLIFLCFLCFVKQVTRRLNLVYGGGSIGLMGLVSQAVHEAGGHVLGYAQIYDLFTLVLCPPLLYYRYSCVICFHLALLLWVRIIPRTLMDKEVA